MLPKKNVAIVASSAFTTVFTGWTASTEDDGSKTALTPVAITVTSWDYNSAVIGFSTAENDWNGNYYIEVSRGKTYSPSDVVYSTTVSKSTSSLNVSGLDEGQEYTIRIVQQLTGTNNTHIVLNDGSYYTFRTKQHVEKVTNLTASTIDVTSLTYTWSNALYASGYAVRFKPGSSVTTSDSSTATTNVGITYTGLTGQSYYTVGVVSKGDNINFGDSTGMTVYTVKTADLVKLTGLTVTATTQDQKNILLKWNIVNTDGLSAYTIYMSTSNVKPDTPYSGVSSATTQLNITNLVANTTYYF